MSKLFHFTWSASLIWLSFQFVLEPWNELRFRSTKHVMRFFEQLWISYYICICALQVVTVDLFSSNLVQTIFSANLLDNSVGQNNPTVIFTLWGSPNILVFGTPNSFYQVAFFPVKYSRARFSKVLSPFVTCLVICFYIY